MGRRLSQLGLLVLLAVGLATSWPSLGISGQPPTPPDLTGGGKPDDTHDWTLGPTGARGWMFGWRLETTEARQILVTKVDPGSPADGRLQTGDVILGVNGRRFDRDARKALGEAITQAEKPANKGLLRLLCWRNGKELEVSLRLKVMGTYSEAAPYNCPKSQAILEGAYRYLAEKGLGSGFVAPINALGVLATGRPELLDRVRDLAYRIGSPNLKLSLADSMCSWGWGYNTIFLCEYHLATGDRYVLPAIRQYATMIAKGQSAVGTWGHGMSLPEYQGRLGGYGAINQAGLGCWLGLLLAQKCGVDDPQVKRAVAKSAEFFRFYVGKGSIPYGDHPPWWFTHDNNGKNAMAAVGFDLLGESASTRFFGRMSTAAYDEREDGHTGNYFSFMWGPLGVARVGREAVAAHLKEQHWFYDLARRWDGGFTYQGGAGQHDSYKNWDMTGAFMLTYALPLRKLYLTGKGTSDANRLTGVQLHQTIEAGRHFSYRNMKDCYVGRSEQELMASLSSWSPVVRFRASNALAKSQANVLPQLVAMLSSPDVNTRLGACETLEYMGQRAAPAVDALVKLLTDRDQWVRIRAAYALAGIGKPAERAAPALLKLALASDENDPRQTTTRYLCFALFMRGHMDNAPRRGLLADSLEGVNRQLLWPAVRKMLSLDDGLARSQITNLFDRLTPEELDSLWPDIVRAVEHQAPSGEMFADGVRLGGLRLLAKHRIEEGMYLALSYAKNQNQWGSENRMGEIMKVLKSYGAAAKPLLPELQQLADYCRTEKNFPAELRKKKAAAVEDAISFIEAATEKPQLRSIKHLLEPQPPANRSAPGATGRTDN